MTTNQYEPRPSPFGPLAILGETTWRSEFRRFGIKEADRLRHLWVLGKTGSGKSTLLENLIAQDLEAGRGLALLDPHGDLVRSVAPKVPKQRFEHTVLFAPGDTDHPISFNVFRRGRDFHPDHGLLASELVAVFHKHWRDSWGPRLEHILRNGILAIARDPRASLLFLYRFLTDEKVRTSVACRIKDPVVASFWQKEFPSWKEGLQAEALSPVLNKLGAFVANQRVRNIVGQERSRIDIGKLMDQRGILLADLKVGDIGEDASRLLGSLLLSQIQLAALSRKAPHPPFILYADEFQYFATDAIATILSESRKYGLGMVVAHQYLAQLTPNLFQALLGNVGSIAAFRMGAEDAARLASEFFPPFSAKDLEAQPRFQMAVRLCINGTTSTAFSARSLAPSPMAIHPIVALEALRRASRARFAGRRADIERQILRFFRT
ncbi:MAG: type IV secretion system DNA-binding domain-containing protein [Deltaproteobacteria bacterium]|nr:type IV secretion system DNA-binding domain-containing protein [Deltaproteobacteria bacterium]